MVAGSLTGLCEDVVAAGPGTLGCAVVDFETGLPTALAVHPAERDVADLDESFMETLSVAAVTWFLAAEPDSPTMGESVQEIHVATDDIHCFAARGPHPGELLMLVVDRQSTRLGMGWIALREARAHFGAAAGGDGIRPATIERPRRVNRAFELRASNRRAAGR